MNHRPAVRFGGPSELLAEHAAELERVEAEQRQAAELDAIAKPLCPDCRKRFGTVPCPDNYHRCEFCARAYARQVLKDARAARVQARREKRAKESMAVPSKRRPV